MTVVETSPSLLTATTTAETVYPLTTVQCHVVEEEEMDDDDVSMTAAPSHEDDDDDPGSTISSDDEEEEATPPPRDKIRSDYRDACREDASVDPANEEETFYYMIDVEWMKSFLAYASSSSDGGAPCPGRVTNKLLLSSSSSSVNELRPDLGHGRDYALVGQRAWETLSSAFGYDVLLNRPVVTLTRGTGGADRFVEVYPRCCSTTRAPRVVMLPLGGRWHLPDEAREDASDDHHAATTTTAMAVAASPQHRMGTSNNHDDDGTTPSFRRPTSTAIVVANTATDPVSPTYAPSSRQLALVSLDGDSDTQTDDHNNHHNNDAQPRRKKIRRITGRCGLSNIGNTCFMNSTLQCLAHTTPLRNYFLSEEYREHLNRRNPLGTGGELATEFSNLLHQMWGTSNHGHTNGTGNHRHYGSYQSHNSSSSDHHSSSSAAVVVPRAFKSALGRHDSRFVGYDQHDSQELATYLLDALHEDTNRVLDKPYVEKTEFEGNGIDDDEAANAAAAARAWEDHKRRDDSRIVDTLMGQVKSRVECPRCGRVSTTFDPFMYLSVPIPGTEERVLEFTWVGLEDDTKEKRRLTIPKSSTIGSLCGRLAEDVGGGLKSENLVVCDVWKNEIYTAYTPNKSVSQLRDADDIYVYELAPREDLAVFLTGPPHSRPNDEDEEHSDGPEHDDGNDRGRASDDVITLEIGFQKGRLLSGAGRSVYSSSTTTTMTGSSYLSEVSFATPFVMRIPSDLTVYGLRRALAERLEAFLDTDKFAEYLRTKPSETEKEDDDAEEPHVLTDDDDDDDDDDDENEPMDEGSEPVASSADEMEPVPVDDQEEPSQQCPAVSFLRRISLSYQRHGGSGMSHHHRRDLGAVRRHDPRQPAASPNDEAERESVAEVVGSKGRVSLFWPHELLEFFNDAAWEHVKELPKEDDSTKKKDTVTVQQCIDHYCKKEQLEESEMWYCNKCRDHVRAWKQFSLFSTPPILIVQLKRFHYSSSSHRRDKIGDFVDFPLNGLDLRGTVSHHDPRRPPVYDCYAVSNHYGNLGGGHYTAYAKNNGQWCYFDDSRVSEVRDESEVVSAAAYVLYYRRRDLSDWDDRSSSSSSFSSSSSSSGSDSSSAASSTRESVDESLAARRRVRATDEEIDENASTTMTSVASHEDRVVGGEMVVSTVSRRDDDDVDPTKTHGSENGTDDACTSPLVDSVDGEEIGFPENGDDDDEDEVPTVGTFPTAT